jgi:hypothetical protein
MCQYYIILNETYILPSLFVIFYEDFWLIKEVKEIISIN